MGDKLKKLILILLIASNSLIAGENLNLLNLCKNKVRTTQYPEITLRALMLLIMKVESRQQAL
jgi:hypothetical protein